MSVPAVVWQRDLRHRAGVCAFRWEVGSRRRGSLQLLGTMNNSNGCVIV